LPEPGLEGFLGWKTFEPVLLLAKHQQRRGEEKAADALLVLYYLPE